MKTGLRKLAKQQNPALTNKRLLITTDSLSLVLALEKGPINQKDPQLAHTWKSLNKLFRRGISRIASYWVPAHCGITRYEFADVRTKTLLENSKDTAQSMYAKLYCSRLLQAHNRTRHHNLLTAEQTDRTKITSDRANLRIEDMLTRAQQSTLDQLRTGTCNTIGCFVGFCRNGYDSHRNDICRWCGDAPETVLHVFIDCADLQILLREEYSEATNNPFTDQIAALEFHASAFRLLGAARGGV